MYLFWQVFMFWKTGNTNKTHPASFLTEQYSKLATISSESLAQPCMVCQEWILAKAVCSSVQIMATIVMNVIFYVTKVNYR